LPEAWRDLGRQYYRSLRPWVLTALVLAILAEALATRVGVLKSWWPKKKKTASATGLGSSR
jgi:hypothetical protein